MVVGTAFSLACTLASLAGPTALSHGQSREERTFPIVVRLSERIFHSPELEVDETTRVELVTLGTRSRGQAVTNGQLQPDFVTSYDKAAFGLVFEGTTRSRTVGRRGPAILQTNTVSSFRQSVPVSFDIENGFTAGTVQGSVQIEKIGHSVSSTAPGLRGRLVRRIAHARLRDKAGQIRAIALQNTQSRIAASMDRRVKAKLSTINQKWFVLREALRQQPWVDDSIRLSFATDESHLLVFISRGEQAPATEETLPVKSLPRSHAEAELELLVQLDELDIREEALSLLSLLASVERPLMLFGESAASALQTEQQGPWSVFRLSFGTANERTFLPTSQPDGDNRLPPAR
jgi:hypothetical protein